MTISLLFQIASLIVLFLVGIYIGGVLLLRDYAKIQKESTWQLRAILKGLPGKLGKEGRGVVDYLVKESVEAEAAEEEG